MINKIKQDFPYKIIMAVSVILLIISCLLPIKQIINIPIFSTTSLISTTEAKTFDLRQRYLSKFRHPSDNIIIISLDNQSFEYLTKYFGYWPMPRSVYVDMANYIEAQNPKVFAIDVQFVGEWNHRPQDDLDLAESFAKYDNMFSAVFFDDKDEETPSNIPEKHSSELNLETKNFSVYSPKTFRASYPAMLEKGNLANVNLNDYYDGIIRSIPMFIEYPVYDEQNNITGSRFYPNLALRIISKYADHDHKAYTIDKNNNIIINGQKIPMKPNSEVILNWYNKKLKNIDNNYNSFFKTVSFKDVFGDIQNQKEGKPTKLPQNLFTDKIVLFGFTAEALFDLKATPIEKYMPGVELYGIFANNFMDNSFIIKINEKQTLILTLILFTLFFGFFYKNKNNLRNLAIFISTVVVYIVLAYVIMYLKHLWIPVILPVLSIILSYLTALILNYFSKSKDYEKLYKLVNTDDLTGLYNKRFFVKHMEMNIEYSTIYKKPFSLIMIDIDHFKKFNDTYGHLSGDCVLKQVAQYLTETTGNKGVVCRYGGEEMCVILPQTAREEAEKHAWELCRKIAASEFTLSDGQKTAVTISLGVSVFPDDAQNTTKLIEYSDKALYYAKEHGRNQVGKNE